MLIISKVNISLEKAEVPSLHLEIDSGQSLYRAIAAGFFEEETMKNNVKSVSGLSSFCQVFCKNYK